jgi:alkylhydroperoxidase family enzyme
VRLTTHTRDTAPADARLLLDGIAADVGMVPNLAAAIAASPTLLAAFDGIRRAVGAGTLDPAHREAAGVAVGVAVDNAYGVAFHSTVLARLGVADDEIKRMRAGEEPVDEPTAAVYALARQLALHRGKDTDAAITRATTAGLSTAHVLEVVGETVFASLVGLIDNLADRVPLDDFLRPQAWTATG